MMTAMIAGALFLAAQDSQEPETEPRVTAEYRDTSKGIHFERKADGRVTLKAPALEEKDGVRESTTWEAASPEEFKREHPEVVRKYGLEPLLRDESKDGRELLEAFEQRMNELQKDFLESWKQAQEKSPGPQPRLGVLVSRVSPPLRSHLGLKEKEGVLILDVLENKTAHRAGLKKYDIITHLNGTPVTDLDAFVRHVREAVGKDGAKLGLIREGEKMDLEVKAEPMPSPR